MDTIFTDLLENADFKERVQHREVVFQLHDKLLTEGQTHAQFYLILDGQVRISIEAQAGESEQPIHPGINDLGAGELVGEFCLFTKDPASADVIAVSETVKTIEFDTQSLLDFFETHPKLGYQVCLELLKRYIGMIRKSNKAVVRLLTWGLKAHKLDRYM